MMGVEYGVALLLLLLIICSCYISCVYVRVYRDFTDSSTSASVRFHATTPVKITSLEFLVSATTSAGGGGGGVGGASTHVSASVSGINNKVPSTQLLACGDEAGTLHVRIITNQLYTLYNECRVFTNIFLTHTCMTPILRHLLCLVHAV